MQAIVLAGGFGTRLKSEVPDLPKPMAPVGGVPFLDHLLRFWIRQGVDEFVLSVHHQWQTIHRYFGDSFQGKSVRYAVEKEPLGTGGAVLYARSLLSSAQPFFIVNGDTFLEVDATAMTEFHRFKKADVTVALATVPQNTRYSGLEVEPDGKIPSFQSQGPTAHTTINGGVYLVNSDDWGPVQKQSLEAELFPRLIAGGKRFFGFPARGRFIDIGIPDDYRRAESIVTSV